MYLGTSYLCVYKSNLMFFGDDKMKKYLDNKTRLKTSFRIVSC